MNTVRLAWHHIILHIPETWEVIGYKKDPAEGQLVLADRAGEALNVHWKQMKSAPVIPRLLTDLVRLGREPKTSQDEDRLEKKIRDRIREVHGWQVYLPDVDNARPLHPPHRARAAFAARFENTTGILILLVFPPHPDTAAQEHILEILASFAPNDGAERTWAVFGLEFTLPATMELDEVVALPACQRLLFENRRGETVAIHRYGMLPAILAGDDPATFYARVKGRRTLLRRAGQFRKDGQHEGVELTYITRGKGGLDSLLAGTWHGRVWLWRCDEEMRLYAIDHHAPAKHHISDLLQRVHAPQPRLAPWPEPPQRHTSRRVAPHHALPSWSEAVRTGDGLLELQLRSIPLRNEAGQVKPTTEGKTEIIVPLRHRWWSRLLQHVLPLSDTKRVELDEIGAAVYALCDGEHTVEELIELHRERWKLSFFEARAMIFAFLRQLMCRNLILLATPRERE